MEYISEEPRGQDRNKDSDVDNGLEDTGMGRVAGVNWESGMDIYILPNVK